MEDSRLGVVDSLSAGLNLVAGRAWVIAIPIVLDLWYWLGPRLSVAPLLEQIERFLARSAQATMPAGPVDPSQAVQMLDVIGQQTNLFALLSTGLLGVPSLMASGVSGNAIEIRSWPLMAGLGALLLLVGLAIGCLYLTLIAEGVGQPAAERRSLLYEAGRAWLRVVGLAAIAAFFAVALVVPFSFLLSLLALVNGGAASFFLGVFYMAVVWLWLYLFFVVYAILVNRVGPLEAIWNSANVVARNFWSVLGLIILIMVLRTGLSLAWRALGRVHPIGMAVGIAGNAFVGSGLVAASVLFYADRYQRWKQQKWQT